MLEQAKEMLEIAKQEIHSAQYAKIKNAAVSVKNEVLEMIAKVRERKGRLDLPIVSGKHLRKISDRTSVQSAENAEEFITIRKINSFESLAKYPEMRGRLQNLIGENESSIHLGGKITPKQWKTEIQCLQSEYDSIGREKSKAATELAYAEVIDYNRKNLERELQNESRRQSVHRLDYRQQGRTK